MKKQMTPFIIPLLILLVWIVTSQLDLINSFLLPSPLKVYQALVQLIQQGVLFYHIGASLTRLLIGFSCSLLLAIFATAIFYFFSKTYLLITPTLKFIQNIPPLAIMPLLILWFGIGEQPKIILIILVCFFPLFINFSEGIKNCDPKLLDLGRVVSFSQKDIFCRILFPNALPYIFTGIKLSIAYGWRSLIGVELLAASAGLGVMVLEARELSRSDMVLAGIFCFGIIGLLIDALFTYLLSTKQRVSYD
ncbi:MAG: ABC transporter permease [Brevinema sp.]